MNGIDYKEKYNELKEYVDDNKIGLSVVAGVFTIIGGIIGFLIGRNK